MLPLTTILEPLGPACAILLTDEQVAELGRAKNPPVVVTIDGKSQRLRVARMGGRNCIGFSKAARAALGVENGQEVTASIALDSAERTVDMPAELTDALAVDLTLKASFDALSFTTRKEHARAVAEAKTPETRARRLIKILEQLRSTTTG